MAEPLTDRLRAILEVLEEERLGDYGDALVVPIINRRAFEGNATNGSLKNELGKLERRGLARAVGLNLDRWEITETGSAAL